MIYTAIDNFYVTKEQLVNSPSRANGVNEEVEEQLRLYGCELIQEGGCLLKLPQAVMATGQVLFHRFYVKESMKNYSVKKVAIACCWLAAKLEESPRRTRDVVSVFYRMERRREGKPLVPLDIYGQKYEELKRDLILVERYMLREFGFIMHVDHPHKFVLNYLTILDVSKELRTKADQGGVDAEALKEEAERLNQDADRLKQEAWRITNDSLRTTLCVRFKGEIVACGIILMASRRLKVALPEDPPWWELFMVRRADMYEVCWEMHRLYSQPKAAYISLHNPPHVPAAAAAPPSGGTPHASPVLANGTPGLSTGGRSAGGGDASAQRANGDAAAGASGSQEDNGDRTGRSAGEARSEGAPSKESGERGTGDKRRERDRKPDRGRDREIVWDRDRDRDRDSDGERDRGTRGREGKSRSRGRGQEERADAAYDRDRGRERDRKAYKREREPHRDSSDYKRRKAQNSRGPNEHRS